MTDFPYVTRRFDSVCYASADWWETDEQQVAGNSVDADLLLSLLVATLANYLETRQMNRALGALYVEMMEVDNHAGEKMTAIDDTLGQTNENLDKLSDLVDCIAYHRAAVETTAEELVRRLHAI